MVNLGGRRAVSDDQLPDHFHILEIFACSHALFITMDAQARAA